MIVGIYIQCSGQTNFIIFLLVTGCCGKVLRAIIKEIFQAVYFHIIKLAQVKFFCPGNIDIISAAALHIPFIFDRTDIKQCQPKPEFVFVQIPAPAITV